MAVRKGSLPQGEGLKGLLWFYKEEKDLLTVVRHAAERYQKKYERTPNIAYVNPWDMDAFGVVDGAIVELGESQVVVKPLATVLPFHIFVAILNRREVKKENG